MNKAKKEIHGDAASSYNRIQHDFDKLKELDPESDFVLEFDEKDRKFDRCFIAYGACISGFRACRPILFLDGTFLKSKFKGQLLIATGKDGNKGLFPIAVVVVRSEDTDNWKSFLEFLRPHVNERVITFMSDRNPGILSAVKSIFPTSHHAFCCKHIGNNLRDKMRGNKFLREKIVSLFNKCSYAPDAERFDLCMEELKREGGKRIELFLANLPKENYSNAYFRGKRYGEMTSAAAESFNNQIKEHRELPAADMLDKIRVMLMKQMCTRRIDAAGWSHVLCPEAEKDFIKNFNACRTWTVAQSSNDLYEVHSDPIMVVDLAKWTCSCCKWQENGFPCPHAIAAIENAKRNPYDFVEDYFHTAKIRECYAMNIPGISTFELERTVSEELCVNPPNCKRPPGRPRTNRIPSRGEIIKRKIRCGRCNSLGRHNRRNCVTAI